MRATTIRFLLILLPCLGACGQDFQLGNPPDPNENDGGSECAPDAGSGPPPMLTLVGPAIQPQECATPYTDPGATATDACFGDLTSHITRSGTVDTHTPGSYPLTYNVTNPAGQSATPVSRTVNVQDTQPPAITISGPRSVALECGSPYSDAGATASDACSGALPAVPTSLPDPGVPGIYSLSYQATDPSGNTSIAPDARTVTVADTLDPTLTINGPLNPAHECGSTYVDPGATAGDLCAGDLSSQVVATRVGNPNQPGTFTINYSVTDPAGNATVAPQPRVVNVTDNTPPVLALVGQATQLQECAIPYTDPGATATDACFGDVTSRITRSGTVNPNTLGSYPLTYNVSDPAGLSATPVSRTVLVHDTRPPGIFTLNGPSSILLECGSSYSDPGATASDACAGSLPAVPNGSPDPSTPGSYSFGYQAVDPSGNTAISPRLRTVSVADTLAPALTINGPLNQVHECGPGYVDPGATADDVCAGDLSSQVVATRTGSPTAEGTMTITYAVADPSGNTTSAPQPRVVDVIDTRPPVLTLLGGSTQALECATPYADPGAAATDACYGDLTGSITRSGTVDPNTLGSYLLTYNVSDPGGRSTTRSRTVDVSDTRPPDSFTLNGPSSILLECGSPYSEPGATAFDACAGSIPAVPVGSPDTSIPGSYSYGYKATDPSGNTAFSSAVRTVSVADTLAPTLTVLGPPDVQHECGATYEDPGATAEDVCFGDLSSEIIVVREGSLHVPGTALFHYSVVEPAGNGVGQLRTVNVTDTLGPELQVLPGPSVIECNGPPYADPGATASDQCTGDLTQEINVTSDLDQSREGQYTITYDVTDPSGNTSVATRPITVVGPCTLCFSLALSGYNLLLLEDSDAVHSVQGRVEAGGEHAAARFAELRGLSSRLAGLSASGVATRESRDVLRLKGTDPALNVFEVEASELTRDTRLSIDAPAGSLVVINVHGERVTLEGLGQAFSGGIGTQDVLYNFVNATSIRAEGSAIEGTVLAPYAHIGFNDGSWKGGLYAVSLTGNAQGHLSPLNVRELCP